MSPSDSEQPPGLMSFEEAVAICGPELIAKLEAHAATAPPFTEEQKRILAAAFAARHHTAPEPTVAKPDAA